MSSQCLKNEHLACSCCENQPQKKRWHAINQLADGMVIKLVLMIVQEELVQNRVMNDVGGKFHFHNKSKI